MTVTIKRATVSDAGHFARINEAIWGAPASDEIVGYFTKGITRFPKGYYLAETGGEYIGSSEGFPIKERIPIASLTCVEDPVDLYDPEGSYYYIHIIQVYPAYRNSGIGNRLLKAQVKAAQSLKLDRICGIAISTQLNHWLRSGFVAEGDWEAYKKFGLFKWIVLRI